MTQTAVPGRIRSQPSIPAQAAWGSPSAWPRVLADHERRRLARELHDGAIQEVLAAGLAIDLCLADGGSPPRPSGACDPRCRTCARARTPLTKRFLTCCGALSPGTPPVSST